MHKVLMTFSGAAYDATTRLIVENGEKFGANEVVVLDDYWLMTTSFYRENRWAWEHPGHKGRRFGFGWYCWKSFAISHVMGRYPLGTVIAYVDADTFPIADFSMLFDLCVDENGFVLFEAMGCKNRQWVKRDVWHAAFPGQDHEPMLDTPHTTARFMLFERGRQSVRSFLKDWNALCTTPGLTTRDPSAAPEYAGFEENRGDQSCLSVMQLAYGLPLHREADAFGEASQRDRDLYPQLFEQIYCQGNRADLSGSKYRRGPGI